MSGELDPPDRRPPAEMEGVQFGDVRTAAAAAIPPPPDCDGHCAVRKIQRPEAAAQVPTDVFVDLDTMLDMQEHAAEDTSVELGGILLGRRGQREDGTPYVIIWDAFRARHYKATRGSFRFTHETWADLSRRRATLPESTEVVGWYHTHPGWGVFLSDLDVFICDHFFSHPDDIALVIDPTSGDTGLFVRRGTTAGRPPGRLAAYFLHSHRKRSETLDQWAAYFSGAKPMSNPPAVFPGRVAPPIIVTGGSETGASSARFAWLLGGILGGQLALVAALIFLVVQRPAAAPAVASAPDTAIREQVMDEWLRTLASGGAEGLQQSYRQMGVRNAELSAANLGLMSRIEQVQAEVSAERKRSERAAREMLGLRERLAATESQLVAAKESPAGATEEGATEEGRAAGESGFQWVAFGSGVGLGAVLAAFAALAWMRPRPTTAEPS